MSKYNFPGDDTPVIRGSALKALEAPDDPANEAYAPIQELMDAVDSYIPTPERAIDKPFLMPVEDVFGIKGRGTVATGRIERGIVKVSEEIEIIGVKATRKVVVTGVEMFKKLLDEGRAGDNVGCLLRGIEREDIERGQVMAKAGSIKPHTKFRAQVYVLTKEEGGRHTPFFNGYRPQFYLRTTDVTGAIGLPEGAEMVMPGDNVEMGVELITPIALEVGRASPSARAAGPSAPAPSPASPSKANGKVEARPDDPARLHRVQGADVHDAEEQEERSEPAGAERSTAHAVENTPSIGRRSRSPADTAGV